MFSNLHGLHKALEFLPVRTWANGPLLEVSRRDIDASQSAGGRGPWRHAGRVVGRVDDFGWCFSGIVMARLWADGKVRSLPRSHAVVSDKKKKTPFFCEACSLFSSGEETYGVTLLHIILVHSSQLPPAGPCLHRPQQNMLQGSCSGFVPML